MNMHATRKEERGRIKRETRKNIHIEKAGNTGVKKVNFKMLKRR